MAITLRSKVKGAERKGDKPWRRSSTCHWGNLWSDPFCDLTQVAMTTWAAKDLPARLDVAATGKLLGFSAQDIQRAN